MRGFCVDEMVGTTFTLFEALHGMLILLAAIGLVIIYHYRHQGYHLSARTKEVIKYDVTIILISIC